MKPICVKCHRFFRPHKTGYYFIEGMPNGSHVPPGLAEPDRWQPYKLWCGDLWECQGCGAQIISGVGHAPLRERYDPDFSWVIKKLKADQFQVNDC